MDANEIRSKVDALADDYFTFGADHMAHKVAELQATLTEAHGFVPDLLTVVVARVNEIASEGRARPLVAPRSCRVRQVSGRARRRGAVLTYSAVVRTNAAVTVKGERVFLTFGDTTVAARGPKGYMKRLLAKDAQVVFVVLWPRTDGANIVKRSYVTYLDVPRPEQTPEFEVVGVLSKLSAEQLTLTVRRNPGGRLHRSFEVTLWGDWHEAPPLDAADLGNVLQVTGDVQAGRLVARHVDLVYPLPAFEPDPPKKVAKQAKKKLHRRPKRLDA